MRGTWWKSMLGWAVVRKDGGIPSPESLLLYVVGACMATFAIVMAGVGLIAGAHWLWHAL